MGEFKSDDHYIYYCGQEESKNAIFGYNLKNDRMVSVHFKGKPFNITVIQVYMPQPLMLKKLKLNGSMKTYKTF